MASSPVRGPVVLTREPPDNDRLRELLEAEGFAVLEWPATRTLWRTPEGAGAGLSAALDRSALTVFTTRRALRAVRRLTPAVRLAGRRLAAAGPATAEELEACGGQGVLRTEGRGWEELRDELLAATAPGERLLLVRSAAADGRLPRDLEAAGRVVEDVSFHEPGEATPQRHEEIAGALFACASPTAARRILDWNPWARRHPFVAIGPTTAEALRDELGVEHVRTAAGPTDPQLLAALLEAAGEMETR